MNGLATFGDQSWQQEIVLCGAQWTPKPAGSCEERQMTSAMTTFLVATGTASAVWLLLTRRVQNRRVRRASPDAGGTSDSGGYSSDSDGWSLANWFGHSAGDGANHSTDSCGGGSSSGDSGGSDCGGGDGGGGGGAD
jgi:hypothetical protein